MNEEKDSSSDDYYKSLNLAGKALWTLGKAKDQRLIVKSMRLFWGCFWAITSCIILYLIYVQPIVKNIINNEQIDMLPLFKGNEFGFFVGSFFVVLVFLFWVVLLFLGIRVFSNNFRKEKEVLLTEEEKWRSKNQL